MTNPLKDGGALPAFDQIEIAHIEPAIREIIEENRQAVEKLLQVGPPYRWETLAQPLEDMGDRLNNAWSVVSHLNAVMNSDTLRDAYKSVLAQLTAYATEMGQNKALYDAWKQLQADTDQASLSQAQRKTIENTLRDFHLSGVDLPDDKKARYSELSQRLSELSSLFSDNVLDATHGWKKHVTDLAELSGLPETALGSARQAAEAEGLDGYLFTLDFPSYQPVMSYCDNRALRQEMYTAFLTRASDQGPNAGQWDNSPVMTEILALRCELAKLLGFINYAERSLATKMAGNVAEVVDFLVELAEKSKPVAQEEYEELKQFALETDGLEPLESWDIGYYGEKLRVHRYDISQEALRPYFPAEKVINGMFDVVQRLFGIRIAEQKHVSLWHPDALYYRIYRGEDEIASFYLDLYARAKKRGGAWMADCRVRRRLNDGSLQKPVAFLTCNFTPPVGSLPALLTHNEVTTLFHEFGHGLHHMLTQVEVADVSGINGVAWDAVELPSQFMENWCWQPEAIELISAHYETGEPLPAEMLDKMLAAKNFQAGLMMVRQLEFSLFDFRLHAEYSEENELSPQAMLEDVRQKVSVITPPAFTRFAQSFSHIFAGGYAAGYYSYKWAEVLAADAFSKFEEQGIFDAQTGREFLQCILEKGGSEEPMELFVAFRGVSLASKPCCVTAASPITDPLAIMHIRQH